MASSRYRVQVKKHVRGSTGPCWTTSSTTSAFIPMALLWSTGLLGEGASATVLAVVPLLASAYQFCRVDAKTDDHLFLGFPSYWNIAAFYIYALDLGPVAAAAVLLVCAVLVFVPIGYVYPSVVWLAISVAYVGYYVALSLYLTTRRGRPATSTG